MDVRFLLLLFFIVSCVPQSQAPKSSISGSKGTTSGGTVGGADQGNTPGTTTLSWNFLNSTTKSITINNSNLNTAYLLGDQLESFLIAPGNFTNANYCVVAEYNLGGDIYQLRARAVPYSFYDFGLKKTVRVLRVDFPDTNNSSSLCGGTLRVQDTSGNYVNEPSPQSIQFSPNTVCTYCTSILNSQSIRLFKKGAALEEVPKNLLNFNQLSLLLDPNNANSGNPGSCSNSQCQASGYDCCLDNQCVKDKAEKPAASTQYASLLEVAKEEMKTNPLAYLKYPQLYYICGSNIPTTPGATTGSSTGGASYDPALEQLKKDYACVQNLKSQARITPFQQEILLGTTFETATDCLTEDADKDFPQYYKKVVERLYTNCGCGQSILEDMIQYCPAYDYVVAETSGGQPVRIECFTPPTDQTPLPSQMTVSVDSRSAPHRFFDNVNGTERKITEGETGFEQEGDKFEYLDDAFIVPNQKDFSMNAILGQMSVSLDKALPAKVVPVQLDQVYQINTTSGLYTPCPTCARDSWLNALTAHPSSSYGTGLQAVGYQVSRETLSFNGKGGNYEDNIFGRACWLPPTMIPHSQPANLTNVAEQRKLRLKTQAAYYVNGYQRDWFGFNKGALIGSFDGVTWFAIGSGRIVKATSTKLFLAINAPFADLATPNMHSVNIMAFNGTNQAPAVDYDPQYHEFDQKQNLAGSCQAHHMCDTDTDCVTSLGWEYMCADVASVSTNWPKFKADGSEEPGYQKLPIDQILQQKRFPSGSTKRCVYRGAGAPCKVDAGQVSDLAQRKLVTCAPNFYCANLGSAGLFNSKISRYAASLDDLPASPNHKFGQDANILGRPLNYLTLNGASLPGDVAASMRASFNNDGNLGLCRPGKAIPQLSNQVSLSDPFTQHQFADPSGRTDYISQIGSCNSALFTERRYASCPVINENSGNYEMFEPGFSAAGNALLARNQNSCGLDSLSSSLTSLPTAGDIASANSLQPYSPFKQIEGRTLATAPIEDKTLVRDACLRRAGQVCHTNLDCGPNRLHADQIDLYPLSFFGNQAEKDYYSETLICGQADPIPNSLDPNYKSYDMSQNRCCREVGQNLTTYTSDVPLVTNPGTLLLDRSKYEAASAGLLTSLPFTSRAPGIAPNAQKRYSRLATVENLGDPDRPYLTAYQNRDVAGNLLSPSENVLTENQWKTLREANSDTCCGGGWIRKFSDGGNDWSKRNRVVLDVTNFQCINSRTVLLTTPEDVRAEYGSDFTSNAALQNRINEDYGDYCKGGYNTNGACAQYGIANSINEIFPASDPYLPFITVNTINPKYTQPANADYYFSPRSGDVDNSTIIDFSTAGRRNIVLKLPSYVKSTTVSQVVLISADDSTTVTCNANSDANNVTNPGQIGATYCGGTCCYSINPTTRIMKVALSGTPPAFANARAGVQFRIQTPGHNGVTNTVNRQRPGSSLYYLKRLASLELSGIPQITHTPLYCSDNADRLVQGIFNPALLTRGQFENASVAFRNGSEWSTNHTALVNEPVFSSHEFKCCTPLGKNATSQDKCCSGFGIAQGTTGKYKCALPSGTDLHVYFNPFVSNEAIGEDKPGGGLREDDFDPRTGEPIFNTTVNQKIADLGINFCVSGRVRQGGAFGEFEPEPQGGETNRSERIYNIIDSSNDNGLLSNAGRTVSVGYTAFTEGFRWNNHFYCDD